MDIGLFIKKAAECDVVSHCTECLAMLFFDQEVEGKVSPLKLLGLYVLLGDLQGNVLSVVTALRSGRKLSH